MEIISSKIPPGAKSGEGNTFTKLILKQLTFKIVVFRKRVGHLAEHVRSTDSLNSHFFLRAAEVTYNCSGVYAVV